MTSENIFREGPNHFDIFMSAAYRSKSEARIPCNLYLRTTTGVAIVEVTAVKGVEWDGETLNFWGRAILKSPNPERHQSQVAFRVTEYQVHKRTGELTITFIDDEVMTFEPTEPIFALRA